MDSRDLQKPAHKRDAARRLYANPLPLTQLPFSLVSYIIDLFTPSLPASALLPRTPVGIYDSLSGTVHVHDEDDVMLLWRRGFFGKGSLSRSEPTWLAREMLRRGLSTKMTAEDLTAQRRQERRVAKIQKAKERLAERLGTPLPETVQVDATPDRLSPPQESLSAEKEPDSTVDEAPLEQLEHLQLQREEAFFLLFAMDAIVIRDDESSDTIDKSEAWRRFLRPPLAPLNLDDILRPDNAFLTSYIVYHHYRSLGWVIRHGVKFCTDWVLYKGADGTGKGGAGPVGGHAEFACLTLLHYEVEEEMSSHESKRQEQKRDWRFINTVNRVCSGVKKTLVLVYVTVPARHRCPPSLIAQGPEACMHLYSVREVLVRRFVATRLRD